MREILFKAKRVDNGEWVEGYFYTQLGTNYIAKWDSHLCIHGFGNLGAPAFFEILPETLCEFTGLYDRNGKSIFENDIVRTKYGRICRICWVSVGGHCGFDLEPLEADHKPPTKYDLWNNLELVEVKKE